MVAIIHGKRYSTDTATCVAEYRNGCDYRRATYIEELLFQKRTGEFFLYGFGGALSKYAQRYSDGTLSSREIITPLTEAEARLWCEQNCSGEEYETIFCVVEE